MTVWVGEMEDSGDSDNKWHGGNQGLPGMNLGETVEMRWAREQK